MFVTINVRAMPNAGVGIMSNPTPEPLVSANFYRLFRRPSPRQSLFLAKANTRRLIIPA
jgi:hypothetical protein